MSLYSEGPVILNEIGGYYVLYSEGPVILNEIGGYCVPLFRGSCNNWGLLCPFIQRVL